MPFLRVSFSTGARGAPNTQSETVTDLRDTPLSPQGPHRQLPIPAPSTWLLCMPVNSIACGNRRSRLTVSLDSESRLLRGPITRHCFLRRRCFQGSSCPPDVSPQSSKVEATPGLPRVIKVPGLVPCGPPRAPPSPAKGVLRNAARDNAHGIDKARRGLVAACALASRRAWSRRILAISRRDCPNGCPIPSADQNN